MKPLARPLKMLPWPVLNAAARRRASRLLFQKNGRSLRDAFLANLELLAEEMHVVAEGCVSRVPPDRAIETVRAARKARAPGTLIWFCGPHGVEGAVIRERNGDGMLVASLHGGSRVVLRPEDVFDTSSDARARRRRS